ncbi:MAG TPA: DNA polymerase/3'-5' exonuclease PolX [Bacteroidetes bacterium]|nr:DNA polymerase/3'-5' exonuclease PolX [Bacteroidota bacterium]
MKSFTNKDVAEFLEEIGILLRLAGENDFKAIAFDRAARTIESLTTPIGVYVANQEVTAIKGIGKSIAEDIYSLFETGEIPVLIALKKQVPPGLIRWLDISGLGPKNVYKIHNSLGITELEELKTACMDGRVAVLPGLGAKSAEKILKSIAWMEQFAERCRLDEAEIIAERMLDLLKNHDGVEEISVAGSYRRNMETIGDVDVLIGANQDHTESLFDAFTGDDSVLEILGRGDTKSSVRTKEGRQVDLRIVKPEQFPAALMYFTGSKDHNVAMRQRARERGMALNEYGLYKLTSDGQTDFDHPVAYTSEADIYQQLGMSWVPPELREDRGEVQWYAEHESMDLIELDDIKGVLHAHSTWSDGKYSIEDMARACISRGYEYLGLTDHSKTAAYAGGLDAKRVQQQWKEIDALNEKFHKEGVQFRVFKGIESDILTDGSLDYDEDILKGFDFIIASVHFSIDMPVDKMLDRLVRAVENPFTTILGHPTGRLLLKRDGSKVDLNHVIERAAMAGTAIEINANPMRLDLDWRYGNKARELGLMTAVCPDAHETAGIDDIRYGVKIARKAKFEKARVLNTKSLSEIEGYFNEGKK